MKEDLLQFIWQFRLFELQGLKTLQGESVEIIKPGMLNRNSGPDFNEAIVKIGTTTWAGNVELHLKTSDWFLHGHHSDPDYDNVILHVVNVHDLKKEELINERPILILQNRIRKNMLSQYEAMMKSKSGLACKSFLHKIDSSFATIYFQRLIVERLQEKAGMVGAILEQTTGDWSETCYILTARYFGMQVNNVPFEQLARSLPLRIISKHRKSTLQVEALLFGQAGLLNDAYTDSYAQALWSEYQYFSKLYGLKAMKSNAWKMMRMRPANFPTVRISQLAKLLVQSESLFSKLITIKDFEQLALLFDTEASAYWTDHYMFDKTAPSSVKHFGKNAIEILLINVVAPILFAYGDHIGEQGLKDRAVDLLSFLKTEQNKITKLFTQQHIQLKTAMDSQAVLHLFAKYCEKKLCLNCAIGNKILTR
jgi:hypothetical protein